KAANAAASVATPGPSRPIPRTGCGIFHRPQTSRCAAAPNASGARRESPGRVPWFFERSHLPELLFAYWLVADAGIPPAPVIHHSRSGNARVVKGLKRLRAEGLERQGAVP